MNTRHLRAAFRALFLCADLLGATILIGITLLNLVAVFKRYVLLDSIAWSEEVMRYASIWLTFLAAAIVSFREEHLSLETFRGVGSPIFRKLHTLSLHLLSALFGGIVLWQGTIYCLKNGMQTAPSTGLPMVFAYSALAVGGGLIMLAELVRAWDTIFPPDEVVPHSEITGDAIL